MAKILRQNQKIFGENSLAVEIKKFGSLAAGLPAAAVTPEEIQSLAQYSSGWFSAILGGNSPAVEDRNSLDYLFGYQLSYLMQNGIPEWESQTTYYKNSFSSHLGSLYLSLIDDNLNNSVSDKEKWALVASSTSINTIVSGKKRATSNQPQFINPNGAAPSFTLEGNATNLIVDINGSIATVSTDIVKAGLTVGPSVTPTCLVNDTSAVDQISTRTWGEYQSESEVIPVDSMGVEMQSFIGQHQIVKISGVTDEYALVFIKSATEIVDAYRGFFTDSTGAPVNRSAFSDNDVVTVLSTGWIFIEDDGATIDISYETPIRSFSSPAVPSTGKYWYDMSINTWKRYDGAAWQVINRTLIGVVGIDSANCVCARSFDFNKDNSAVNNIELEISSADIIKIKNKDSKVKVHGEEFFFSFNSDSWNMTTDLALAADMYNAAEQSSTYYYIYLKDTGETVISDISPHYRKDLMGKYHPHNPWRMLGEFYNGSSSDIERLSDEVKDNSEVILHTSGGHGSINTRIKRFSVTQDYVGTSVEYEDSATLGMSAKIRKKGKYAIHFYDAYTSTIQQSGLSLNTTLPTTDVHSLPVTELLAESFSAGGSFTQVASWTGFFIPGDVVRCHDTGLGNLSRSRFVITKVS